MVIIITEILFNSFHLLRIVSNRFPQNLSTYIEVSVPEVESLVTGFGITTKFVLHEVPLTGFNAIKKYKIS